MFRTPTTLLQNTTIEKTIPAEYGLDQFLDDVRPSFISPFPMVGWGKEDP